jgi:hypothetical protein
VATNNFNPDPANDSFEPLMSFFDSQGVNRLESVNISSYGFDGFIPTVIQNRSASGILPGMSISLTGSSTGQNFYKVLSNNIDDRAVSDAPLGEAVIEYLDNDQIVQILSASVSDIFSVAYDDWSQKELGTNGWYLSNSGNAIFSNVAVRGRIEATEGVIEGNLTLGGSLTASTNTGQLILSSSGIFGSTNNGLFHLDNIDGEITFTGNINARGGALKYLTIGNNFYPALSIVGQPSSSVMANAGFIDSSNIIMTVFQERLTPAEATVNPNAGFKYPKEFINNQSDGTAIKRYLAQGDYFILSNVSPSGSITTRVLTFSGGQFVTGSALVHNQPQTMRDFIEGTYEVLTASVGITSAVESGSVTVFDRYYCRKYAISYPSLVDFSLMSASSGSFTSGFSFIGEYTSLNGSEVTRIDGLVLESVRPGTTWYDYIPDFLDLSGRFRLGYGSIIRNTSRLIAEGDLKNKQEVYSVSSSVFTLPTGSGGSQDSIDEKYSNYIFEINPPGASCVVTIFTTLFADRDYFDFINIKAGASITFSISGTPLQAPNNSWINSYQNKKVLSGQWSSARIQKRSASSWFLTGDLS